MQDKLSDYGYSFQIKLIVALILDRTFFRQLITIIDPNYFENTSIRYLISGIKSFYEKYKQAPSFADLKIIMQNTEDELIVNELKNIFKECKKYVKTNLEPIKDNAKEFCQNKELKNAINQSIDYLKIGDYDNIKIVIDNALKAGNITDIGHDWFNDIKTRYEEQVREPIQTSIPLIDDLLDGGLGKGDLGIMVAPPGGGKSWLLQIITANAILQNKNVVYYSFELGQEYVGLRIDSVLTGINFRDLKYHKDDITKKVKQTGDRLRIKFFPSKSITTNGLRSHIESMKIDGFEPDMVVIDYGDKMKTMNMTSRTRDDKIIGNLFDEIKGLAGELQLPIWTASQSGRSSIQQDIIQGDTISESLEKLMIADFVASISRKLEDKIGNTTRMFIIKNRYGPDGLTFPGKFDTNNGKLELYDGASSAATELNTKMQDVGKKYMKSRYNDFMKK